MSRIYLSRRNLEILLAKLDRKKSGENTECTIIKTDSTNRKYPQSMKSITVTAVENDDYYVDRFPGFMHPSDEKMVEL